MAKEPRGNEPWRDYARKSLETELTELRMKLIDDNPQPPQLVPAGSPPPPPKKGSLIKEVEAETERDGTYKLHQPLYKKVVVVYLLLQLALGLLVWSAIGFSKEVDLAKGLPINPGLGVLLLQLIHLCASLKIVKVDDLAGIDLFGKPLHQPKAGLYVVPLFILTLTVTLRNYQDVRFPGPPDKIYRVSEGNQQTEPGGDMPPVGSNLFRPIFVTTGEPNLTPEERAEREKGKTNPLDEQQTIEISYFIRYRPNHENGGIFRLIRNIGGIRGKSAEETRERIVDLLREQSERDIKSIITQQTYATVVENWQLINEVFALKLQESILRLGIQIDPRGAGLDDGNPSRTTNVAQAEVAREQFRRNQAVVKADGQRQITILEGQGKAEAERLRLVALAEGYKKIREDAGVDGEAVLASETAKLALSEKADTLVLGTGGVEQLFGLVKAGQGMLSRPAPTQPTPPTPPAAPSGEQQGT